MRSLHIPMTFEEWDRMPWRFGWKHEYFHGEAHITPRHDHVHVRFRGSIPSSELPDGLHMRPVVPDDAPALIEAFIETFEDGVEFCDWPEEKIHEHAEMNITEYFAGRRGEAMEASNIVLEGDRIVGAALLCHRDEEPVLDLLMVGPGFRRKGIARSLVGVAVEELRERGEGENLRSAYHAANVESTKWHESFGFEEEPDIFLAKMRRMFYIHESSRFPENSEERARLEALYEKWSRRAEELEEVADREGFEAVAPVLRYSWRVR
ncbi:MAG: GNAT family N-acetyltransferase [Rubrobacteraceae bacterium]